MKNLVQDKSFCFALRIVKLCKYLQKTKHESVMTKQLLRCGTSIGANVAEAHYAQSSAAVHGVAKSWTQLNSWTECISEKKTAQSMSVIWSHLYLNNKKKGG